MIPLKLTLKGIYSYQTEQTIDFESLTRNHLFGIFGPVGSGKSAILEAMSYAIYGETERLNTRDGRNYNMMNLKSNELLIDFTFKSGTRNSEQYRFTVKGKRDKKDFNLVRTLDRAAYRLENASWIPIDISTAEEIIGLSYDNFRRTIIIPQGKFQEFLQLGDADRTKMMKEIFNLDRYDLSEKTDLVERRNSADLQAVLGQLNLIGAVDQATIDAESAKRQALIDQRHRVEKTLETNEASEKALQDVKALFDKRVQQEADLEKLQGREAYFQQREQLIEEYEVCLKNFPDLLKQRKALETAVRDRSERLANTNVAANNLIKEIQRSEKEFDEVKQAFEKRHNLEVEWKELEWIENILVIDEELSTLGQRKVKLAKELVSRISSLDALNNKKQRAEADLKSGKHNLPDQKQLVEIKRWIDKRDSLRERIKELQESVRESQDEIAALVKERDEILQRELVKAHMTVRERQLPLIEVISLFKSEIKECKAQADAHQDEIDSLKKQEALELFATELKEGDPCPLCGSNHHPSIYAEEGVKVKIAGLSRDKKRFEKEAEGLRENVQALMELHTKTNGLEKAKTKAAKELESKSRDLKDHSKTFTWKEYEGRGIDWINKELARADTIKDNIDQLEKDLEDIRGSIDTTTQQVSTKKEDLQLIATQSSDLNGNRKALIAQIRHFSKPQMAKMTSGSIKREIAERKSSLQTIERRYKTLDGSIRAKKEEHSNLVGTMQAEQKLLEQQIEELTSIDRELQKRLKTSGMKTVKAVEEILGNKLNVNKEKIEIQDYRNKVASAEDHGRKLEKELRGKKYDAKAHSELKFTIGESKQQLRQVNQDIGLRESRMRQLSTNLRLKTELEARRQKLDVRKENLATLRKLFRGGKFVNYASRVYLENLCGIANQRFAQLTRQKLRLELRDDNSFQVRDFLNDGKVRSVKTLSGGQTFQASLSLALSLVDNLQQFARSNENFFFLDEGFGTLDKDSLDIVFDALKSLRKDNRIVGVISHVEEMQQEIENCVRVRLDSSAGSVIEHEF